MRWLRKFIRDEREEHRLAMVGLRERFACFRALLARNNEVLRVMADLEEKSHGQHLFDTNYLRASLETMRVGVEDIIDRLIALGGEQYATLRERHEAIESELDAIIEGKRAIERDAYTIPIEDLGRERAASVGSKSAQLGELRSRLHLPVPDGFAPARRSWPWSPPVPSRRTWPTTSAGPPRS
jgi:pyruvate,water dikinase